MATLKFGKQGVGLPTPQWATNIFRVVLYASAATAIVLNTFTEIPPAVQLVILKYCAEASAAVHLLSKLVGIDTGDIPGNGQPKS